MQKNENVSIDNCQEKNKYNENYTQRKRRIRVVFTRVSLLAMLLIFSTYAWFTSQKDITLSNIRGTVEVVENMEISLDAKNWYQEIDLTEAEVLFAAAQESRDYALSENDKKDKTTALAIVPSQFLPVSGVGELSETLLPMYNGEATSTSLSGIVKCLEKGKDDSGLDIPIDNGYFAFDIYVKNNSRDNENDVLQLNVNSAAQVLTESIKKNVIDDYGNEVEREYKGNEDSGLQNTVRVALAMYNGEIESTATQLEILTATKGATIKDLAIWEPNAYDHVETIVANNNKLINETAENPIPFQNGEAVDTYALNSSSVTAGTIENVYNIKSTGLGLQGTFKTDNVKDGDGKVVDYRIYTEDAKPLDLKNTSGNNFEIQANKVTRFRVYVWLEGQDVDCINVASLGGGLELDLGLTKDDEIGDGAGNRLLAAVDYDLTEVAEGEVTATITANRELAELPAGWSYGVTEAVAVASTENVKIATSSTNKNVISKVFSENTTEYVTLKDGEGNGTVVKVKIESLEEIPTYTITYMNSDGTHTYYEETVKHGKDATYSDEPTEDPAIYGYVSFTYWRTLPNSSGVRADLTNITSDMTVYAYFTTCFVAGTQVLTETGYKNIEDIVVGEKVYTLNLDNNQRELKEVIETIQSYTTEIYEITIGDELIEATPRHQFYIVDKGWIRAYELEEGDMVVAKDNENLVIDNIKLTTYQEEIPVYNLEVDGNHNYLVTELEVLVHNLPSPT